MENSYNSVPMQREIELKRRADHAEVERDLYKDICDQQSRGILALQGQIAALQQRVNYLETGGEDYQTKPWIEKVIQCIEDAGEPLTAAEIFQHLDRRDRGRLCQLKNPRMMLSVVLCRGVKADRLFKDCRLGTAKAVYDVW